MSRRGGRATTGAAKRSAGVVITRPRDGEPEFLLLRAYRNWDFPKGEVEAGEEPLAAARREVAEETGLSDLAFIWGTMFCETPPYGRGKVARYYVAQSLGARVHLPVNPALGRPEHHEFRWLTYPEARPLLVARLQVVLDWARDTIGSHGG
ncbi:MAG: bis(5'-nucleosyl)-tetraphosphatase [Gammaproteobacteria bacterium]